ncbi:MAG: AMP-binding protein [Thermaerobacter sp.]|nr:AMP-binding protein [Thermaerobacter sp.]
MDGLGVPGPVPLPEGSNLGDYAAARRDFRVEIPERFNFAADVLDRWAADPARTALWRVDGEGREERLTFAQVAERSRRVAAALSGLGVAKGDLVLVLLPRLAAWWETMTGLIRLGAVPVPGTTQLSARDLAFRMGATGAGVIVTDQENAPKVEEACRQGPKLTHRILVDGERPGWLSYEQLLAAAPADFRADTRAADPALLYFTSGTTGHPKMVLHSHGYAAAHLITGRLWLDLKPTDLHWNVSDTGWAKAAWSSLFGPWNCGAAVFVDDARGRFDPGRTLDLLERYPITTLCAPPTVYRLLVQEDLAARRFPSLRHCAGAGEPLNPEVIETWRRDTGITIRDGYGQTETVAIVANFPCLAVRPGSMGKPSPGFDVAVVDAAGRELPPGEEGDIAVRARPHWPLGLYREIWGDPGAVERGLRGDWYITGDRGSVDPDGYFWFVGRADDVIITAGYRVGPFEVESALVEHPAVVEAAVVGSPDPVRGEIIKAFVVPSPGHEPSPQLAAQLQEHVKRTTAPYKYPREVEFVTELPKTVSGKIRRIELREAERRRKSEGGGGGC